MTNITEGSLFEAGTQKLVVFNDGSGDKLYFDAEPNDGDLRTLYRWDGSTIEAAPNFSGTDEVADMVVFNNTIYFSSTPTGKYNHTKWAATNTYDNNRLYKYDGTSVTQVKDFSSDVYEDPNISSFTFFNNKLFFAVSYFGSGKYARIYSIDDSGTMTSEFAKKTSGVNTTIGNLVIRDDELYFHLREYNSGGVNHIYKYNSTNNTTNISSSATGFDTSDMSNLTSYEDGLLYQQNTGDGKELQYLNLLNSTVTQLTDINDTPNDSNGSGDSMQNNSAESPYVVYQGNIAPLVNAMGRTDFVSKGATDHVVNDELEVYEIDDGLIKSAKVSFLSGFVAGDTLSVTDGSGISSSYNVATGVLTLTGETTPEAYQTVLRTLAISPANSDGMRVLLLQATDTYDKISTTVAESAKFNLYVADGTVSNLSFDTQPGDLTDYSNVDEYYDEPLVDQFTMTDEALGNIVFKSTNGGLSTTFDSLVATVDNDWGGNTAHGLIYNDDNDDVELYLDSNTNENPQYLAMKFDNAASFLHFKIKDELWWGHFDTVTVTGFKEGVQVAQETFNYNYEGNLYASEAGFSSVDELRFHADSSQESDPDTDIVGFTASFDDLVFVTPQNDVPTVTGAPSDITALTEDTLGNIDLSAVTFSDDDELTVTLTASAGTFAAPADGASTGVSGVEETKVSDTVITLVGSAADINTYLDTASNIQYTGAQDASGDDAATITISATDGSGNLASNPSVNLDITAVNDAPVLNNIDNSSVPMGNVASEYLDYDVDWSVSDDDSSNFNGGYLLIELTSGTDDGSFLSEDTDNLSFGPSAGLADGVPTAGDTVFWDNNGGGTGSFGTVHSTHTGQSGANLRIDFSSDDATATAVSTVLGWLKYSTATEGDRVFSVTVSDGDGDVSTAASFTMQVVDNTAPTVLSIERQTPTDADTNADTLVWRVTFSEAVTAIDTGDFSVSGTSGTVSNVASAGGNAYDVTVSGGDLTSYDGNVTLSFAGAQNITDSGNTPNPLTNTTPSGANNASYTVDNTAPTLNAAGSTCMC